MSCTTVRSCLFQGRVVVCASAGHWRGLVDVDLRANSQGAITGTCCMHRVALNCPPLAPCIGQSVGFDLAGAEILFSNLGGYGPLMPTGVSDGLQGIRYVNVGTFSTPGGSTAFFDLVLENRTAYTPANASLNGLRGAFMFIEESSAALSCTNEMVTRKVVPILIGAEVSSEL